MYLMTINFKRVLLHTYTINEIPQITLVLDREYLGVLKSLTYHFRYIGMSLSKSKHLVNYPGKYKWINLKVG